MSARDANNNSKVLGGGVVRHRDELIQLIIHRYVQSAGQGVPAAGTYFCTVRLHRDQRLL